MSENQDKYESIYRENRDDLYVYIVRSVRDENTALDVLHDAFLNFFRHFNDNELLNRRESRMYLFRIARNLIINNSRSAYNRKVDLGEMTLISSGSSNQSGPEASVVRDDNERRYEKILHELLDELKEHERSALILRFYHDMKLEEISDVLGISISSVSRMVKKGLEKMEKRAKKMGYDADIGDL